MKRLIIVTLVIGIIGGCSNVYNKDKIEAYKRWHRWQSRALCSVGREHLKVGDLDKARTSAMDALSRDPEYVPARVLLAKVLLEEGRYAEAAAELRQAEQGQPESPEIPYLLGIALEKRGEHAESLKCYQKACALDPPNAAYVTASAEVLVAMGRPRGALELLEARLERSDDDSTVLALAGELAMLVDEPGKAADFFQRCLDLEPKSILMRENLAKACFFAGRYAEALENLEKLTQHSEYGHTAAWVYVITGDSHMALNRPKAARGAYETAADIDPNAAPVWARLAKADMALGDVAAATAAARRALSLTDQCLEATVVLGYAMLRQGKPQDATVLLAAAAEKHPDDATLKCMLGRSYAAQGQMDQAAACYRQALESDPGHPLAKSLLAVMGQPNRLR